MKIPIATYRLQFNAAFPFSAARRILPYLAELGISDIYASPIFRARPGSDHGYDVADPTELNPELGTEEAFEALIGEVQRLGMGWVQDIVPNHMAYDGSNRLLMNIFEIGRDSPVARFFDIDWNHPDHRLRGRVIAPLLGRPLPAALEAKEIRLAIDRDGFCIRYYDLRLPVHAASTVELLDATLERLGRDRGDADPDASRVAALRNAVDSLIRSRPAPDVHDRMQALNGRLGTLCGSRPRVDNAVRSVLSKIHHTDRMLEHLLDRQIYRLAYWKTASRLINYRRFFVVNELISLKVELEEVFVHVHSLILRWVRDGKITGLRVDHIDGLYDPGVYLRRLRRTAGDVYCVVEKILGGDESLRPSWPVEGTTGYDFLNRVNGLYCDGARKAAFHDLYTQYIKRKPSQERLMYAKQHQIIQRYMQGDAENLTRLLSESLGPRRSGRGEAIDRLKAAVMEAAVCFSVYRTYVDERGFRETDRSFIKAAIRKARKFSPGLLHELHLLRRVLLLEHEAGLSREIKRKRVHFGMRFQQFTGPLMAKGFEDTTLYVYNRLLSLNEVGGDPDPFGTTVAAWHLYHLDRIRRWPHTMNATSTHDTKRGEDTRARINVLSEIPEEWKENINLWHDLNRKARPRVGDKWVPGRNHEYFLYQTLIGAYPFGTGDFAGFVERIKAYMIKAAKEAKVHTGFAQPDTQYEAALLVFIEKILSNPGKSPFIKSFERFQRKVACYGILNSLSQTLLKATAPGVPDFYQGTELWDLTLVDPDNRRPVDFSIRARALRDIRAKMRADCLSLTAELWSSREDGRIKLFLTHQALQARRTRRDVFDGGEYIPCEVEGSRKNHIVAFARRNRSAWAMTVAPRLCAALVPEGASPIGPNVWADTRVRLPKGAPRRWRDALTDRIVRGERDLSIADILSHFPAGLLIDAGRR